MSEEEQKQMRELEANGGYPTRTSQLKRLSIAQLIFLRGRATMNRARASDWQTRRAMIQLCKRINAVINEKIDAMLEKFADPFGIFKPMSESERAGVSMELLERNEMREEMAA